MGILNQFNLSLSFEEIFYSALLAFFITWFIQNIIKIRRIIKRTSDEFTYPSRDISKILERCYALFPKDNVQFRGQIYKRGMKIQITTLQKKSFEGEFIGCNNKDMVCILTQKYIIAHEINNIQDIKVLDGFNRQV